MVTDNQSVPVSDASPTVLDPMTMGSWTVESVDMLLGLSGVSGFAEHLFRPADGDYAYFEWSTPVHLAGMDVWMFVVANEDPSTEDPDQWAWHFEVRTKEDFESSRLLGSHKFRTRAEAVRLACEFLNVCEYLAPATAVVAVTEDEFGG